MNLSFAIKRRKIKDASPESGRRKIPFQAPGKRPAKKSFEAPTPNE
jgi:hypothetical protein